MHHLVAAYLEYRAPEPDDAEDEGGGTPGFLNAMGKGIPPPAGLATASNAEEALSALERMFFGEVKNLG